MTALRLPSAGVPPRSGDMIGARLWVALALGHFTVRTVYRTVDSRVQVGRLVGIAQRSSPVRSPDAGPGPPGWTGRAVADGWQSVGGRLAQRFFARVGWWGVGLAQRNMAPQLIGWGAGAIRASTFVE